MPLPTNNYSPSTASQIREKETQQINLKSLIGWGLLSSSVWVLVLISGPLGQWIGSIYIICLMLYILILFFKRKILGSLCFLVYLATIEPIIRTYTNSLPYLGLEYFFLGWAIGVGLIVKKKRFAHWTPFIFYLLYLLLELTGLLAAIDLENARSIIILSLTIGASLFTSTRIKILKYDLIKIFTFLLIGVTNILVIIGYGYLVNPTIQWGSESSSTTSGGMGPVQISMLLALGIISLILLIEKSDIKYKTIYVIGIAVIFIGMILTFSRNGLYLVGIACLCYFLLFQRLSFKSFAIFTVLIMLGYFAFNIGTRFAGPALISRYSDLNPTNRDTLVNYGWQIFLENPVLGVGTGNYSNEVARPEYLGSRSGAHNEFIRAAAEHGILGMAFWTLSAISTIWVGIKVKSTKTRALRMTLLAVFFAYLAVNGVKLLIQPLSLLIALSIEDF